MAIAAVAQLAAERQGKDDRSCRKVQAYAAVLGVVLSLALSYVGRWIDREALCTVMRFGLLTATLSAGCWLLMTPDNERSLFPRLLCAVLYVGLIAFVLLVGLLICILAMEVLIFGDGGPLDTLYEIAFLACYTLLAPNLLCGRLPRSTITCARRAPTTSSRDTLRCLCA